jgi:ABC-type Fe3+ transport system substrate-binding protein
MDDIEQAFNKAMQESISTRQRIYRLNQKSNDESAKILNQPEWSKITDKIYDEHNGHTKDKMIASVVVYKHPDYNKKLLNSSTLDLSPASLFGCEFPDSLATQRAAQAALELNSSDFENNGAEY